jgi:hypothetical protein
LAGDRVLTVRAWQITRPTARERLATALEALLDPERSRMDWSTRVPVCREEIAVAGSAILEVAARLRDARPVHPRGVAMVRRLLSDGGSPLYVPTHNDELWRAVRRAATALD